MKRFIESYNSIVAAILTFFIGIFLWTSPTWAKARDIFSEVGIRPKFEKSYPEKIQGHDKDDPEIYLLNVELGSLSPDQFKKVHAYFRGQSSIEYRPGRHYRLYDFLPPVMQALLGKSVGPLDMSSLKYPKDKDGESDPFFLDNLGLKSGFSDYVNCIGTAFEISRSIELQGGAGAYYLYSPGRIDASEILSDRRHFETKPTSRLRFGDILYIADPSTADENYPAMVQHMAIFVTKNIYFEKRDSTQKDPYRLVFIEDIQKRLKRVFGKSRLTYRHGRLTQGGLAQLALKDNRSYLDEAIRQLPSETEKSDAEKVFRGLSPQIQSAVWSLSTDEIGLGGGPEYGMSLAEPITIKKQGDHIVIEARPETLGRIVQY